MSDHEKNKTGDLAKNIWLAGLGAYGKAFDEASERYEKVSKETTRLFDDLVVKGKNLEDHTSDKITHTITDVKDKSSNSLDERITKVRQSLGFGEFSKDNKLDELNQKVDAISAKLDKLIDALGQAEAKPSRSRSAKSSPAKTEA